MRGGAGARRPSARIVYVSCDVATLARDVKALVAAGFAVASLDGFDLFPNTAHVETLAVLQRGDDDSAESFSVACAASRKPRNRPWKRPRLPEVLRVPLHAEAEARGRVLDRFDDAVGRGGRRPSSPRRAASRA